MLPPTSEALKQHIFRSVYQASIIWGQSLVAKPVNLSPENWGWKKNSDGKWEILWTELDTVYEMCSELCKCACKKECTGRCSCNKSNLKCSSMCLCPCYLDQVDE